MTTAEHQQPAPRDDAVPGPRACEVVVVGAGPAGLTAAAALADAGVDVCIVDDRLGDPWTATYGAWDDELDPSVPRAVICARPLILGTIEPQPHALSRSYAILDNRALAADLLARIPPARRVRCRAARVGADSVDVVADAAILRGEDERASERAIATRVIDARLVIDARGAGDPERRRAVAVAQTALGVFVPPAAVARSALAPYLGDDDGALFMDWRPAPGAAAGLPTFLYAVPTGDDRGILLEETALAAAPPLPLDTLARRLAARLAMLHVDADVDERISAGAVERVFIPLDVAPATPTAPFRFGAAGGGVHPATGYSVARALRDARRMAGALAAALAHPEADAASLARAAYGAVWPPSRRVAHALLTRGSEAILDLTHADQASAFFTAFFALPDEDVRAFLAGDRGGGVARAMARLWPRLSGGLGLRVSRAALFGHRTEDSHRSRHARRRQDEAPAAGGGRS